MIPAFRTADWNTSRRFYTEKLRFRVLFEWRHGVAFPCFAGIEREGASALGPRRAVGYGPRWARDHLQRAALTVLSGAQPDSYLHGSQITVLTS